MDGYDTFAVVRNHEEQYSIFPVDLPNPPGWEPTGFVGDRDACLAHIDEVWVDMSPKSSRPAS